MDEFLQPNSSMGQLGATGAGFNTLQMNRRQSFANQNVNKPGNESLASKFKKEDPWQHEQDELLRLQYDYDFIQGLVSPDYLKYLSRKGYFQDEAFLNYLRYLQYWRKPEFMKLLQQPQCVDVVEMLLQDEIRDEIISRNEDFAIYLTL